jgi:hypothetical protein
VIHAALALLTGNWKLVGIGLAVAAAGLLAVHLNNAAYDRGYAAREALYRQEAADANARGQAARDRCAADPAGCMRDDPNRRD